jgi:hypothetical protein
LEIFLRTTNRIKQAEHLFRNYDGAVCTKGWRMESRWRRGSGALRLRLSLGLKQRIPNTRRIAVHKAGGWRRAEGRKEACLFQYCWIWSLE